MNSQLCFIGSRRVLDAIDHLGLESLAFVDQFLDALRSSFRYVRKAFFVAGLTTLLRRRYIAFGSGFFFRFANFVVTLCGINLVSFFAGCSFGFGRLFRFQVACLFFGGNVLAQRFAAGLVLGQSFVLD